MTPVLFIGHGHPLNAIQRNAFSAALNRASADLPRPDAILVVSAHWLSRNGIGVSATETPETIYDCGARELPLREFSVRQHQHALFPHRLNR
mgnify:CR=1 FL=1